MLCAVCREDLDSKDFKPEDYLHAKIHCNVPRCLSCSKLKADQRINRREAALEALGQTTKRMKVVAAHKVKLSKAERKRIAREKKLARRTKRVVEGQDPWKAMNHAEKRNCLMERRPQAELILERALIQNKIKHHPQHAFGGFWIDFRIMPGLVGVEVDGGYHFTEEQQAKDSERTKFLQKNGWRIVRFTNEEVESSIDNVIRKINETRLEEIRAKEKIRKSPSPGTIVVVPPSPMFTHQ